MVEEDGVLITALIESEEFPAQEAGMQSNEIITGIDSINIINAEEFSKILDSKSPGDQITVTTNATTYNITLAPNPSDENKAYLGVYVRPHTKIKESFKETYGSLTPTIIIWFMGLLYWLYVLNLGIGLFNLAPMGPLDGGRMLLVALQKFMDEKKARKYWKNIGFFFLALVLVNVLFAFFR
jgi:membrane-associated protease RseP (regulator of RpoE activity)